MRVAFVPGVILTKWRRTWAERYPRTPLETFEVTEADQRRVLVSGEVDFCFARLPLDTEGLHLIRLYEEQPVVWVAKDHPISLYDEVTTADLADEDVRTEVTDETIAMVAGGGVVLRVPLSVARAHSRRDLAHRPVTDAPTTTVGLAWLADRDDPVLDDFVGVVRGRSATSSRTVQERSRRR